MTLDAATRATVLDIVSDNDDTSERIEALIQRYNDAEKCRDVIGMSAAQSQIKMLKEKVSK